MTEPSIDEIVRKLTSAQREVVIQTTHKRPYSDVEGRSRVALFRKGILMSCAGEKPEFVLTEFGLAVRNHLQGEQT